MDHSTSKSDTKQKRWPDFHVCCFIFLSLTSLIFAIAEAISFYFYLGSGGLNSTAGSFWGWSFFIHLGTWLVSGLLILISIILLIFRKRRLYNLITIVIGILLWASANCVHIYASFGFSFDRGRAESLRYFAHNEADLQDLRWIKQAIKQYTKKNEGRLPPAEK